MKNLFFITITTLLIFSACKSKKGAVSDTACNSCEDAIIRNYGDPALDGCGWVVDVSSIIYMPKNLLPEFYVDSLNVRIKYNVVERVNCGMVKDAHQAIFIEEIQKK
jgi:hypothetical protein